MSRPEDAGLSRKLMNATPSAASPAKSPNASMTSRIGRSSSPGSHRIASDMHRTGVDLELGVTPCSRRLPDLHIPPLFASQAPLRIRAVLRATFRDLGYLEC